MAKQGHERSNADHGLAKEGEDGEEEDEAGFQVVTPQLVYALECLHHVYIDHRLGYGDDRTPSTP